VAFVTHGDARVGEVPSVLEGELAPLGHHPSDPADAESVVLRHQFRTTRGASAAKQAGQAADPEGTVLVVGVDAGASAAKQAGQAADPGGPVLVVGVDAGGSAGKRVAEAA